jgi:hypothetical protein
MGQWTMGHWDTGIGRVGQADNAQWDNWILGSGTKEQWSSVKMDNGILDK